MNSDTKITCLCGKHVDGPQMPMSLRKFDSELQYQCAQALQTLVPLEQEEHILNYELWYLVKNRFRYDIAYKEHDMLIPRREVATRGELNVQENIELESIINELSNQYDLMFENFSHRRSIKNLFHLHLASYYPTRAQMKL